MREAVPGQLAAANALTGTLRWVGRAAGLGMGDALSVYPGMLRPPSSHVSSPADTCRAGCALPRAAHCKLVLQCPVI